MGKKVDISDFINNRGDPAKFKNCTPESVEAYSLLIEARLDGKLDHKTNRDIARYMIDKWGWTRQVKTIAEQFSKDLENVKKQRQKA